MVRGWNGLGEGDEGPEDSAAGSWGGDDEAGVGEEAEDGGEETAMEAEGCGEGAAGGGAAGREGGEEGGAEVWG